MLPYLVRLGGVFRLSELSDGRKTPELKDMGGGSSHVQPPRALSRTGWIALLSAAK